MDRKYFIRITLLVSLSVLCACTSPTHQDMVGTWESDDGRSICLYQNGTVLIKDLPNSHLIIRNSISLPQGTWELCNDGYDNSIYFCLPSPYVKGTYEFSLFVDVNYEFLWNKKGRWVILVFDKNEDLYFFYKVSSETPQLSVGTDL